MDNLSTERRSANMRQIRSKNTAPEIILREAGGAITDLFGKPLSYNQAEVQNRNGVVASNGAAHAQIIEGRRPQLCQLRSIWHQNKNFRSFSV